MDYRREAVFALLLVVVEKREFGEPAHFRLVAGFRGRGEVRPERGEVLLGQRGRGDGAEKEKSGAQHQGFLGQLL